jgi:hypothetical protein
MYGFILNVEILDSLTKIITIQKGKKNEENICIDDWHIP